MKKLMIILMLFLINNHSFSQGRFNTYESNLKYTPRSYDQLAILPMEMKRRHDSNLEYLYSLMEWIIELKTEIKEEKYLGLLDTFYNSLDQSQKGKRAPYTYSDLKQTELIIKDKIIKEYNNEIEKKSNLEYLYSLMEWIIELKTEIKGEQNLDLLNTFYDSLDKSRIGERMPYTYSDLKETEIIIKGIKVSEYKK